MLVTSDTFGEALEKISRWPDMAVDTETTGLRVFDRHRLCGISIGREDRTFYFPFRHGAGRNLPLDWLPRVIDVLQTRERLYMWNAKFDLHVLMQDGYVIPTPHLFDDWSPVEDVMQAAHLVNENEHTYGLKGLADKYLGPESSRDEDELRVHVEARFGKQTNKEWKGLMWKLEPELVTEYAESDVDLTWRMRDFLLPCLEAWDLLNDEPILNVYDVMNKYMLLFARMEARGILVDVDRLRQMEEQAAIRIEELRDSIESMTGGAITNPGSAPQTHRWFKVNSTARVVLERQFRGDPVARAVLEYKGIEKALTSYFRKYQTSVYPDGRMRANFNLIGTYTGRLSCSDPNLTAVPRYDDSVEASMIRKVKDVFIADEGMYLGDFDLSQAELRVASHYGGIAMANRALRSDATGQKYRRLLKIVHDEDGNERYLSPMGQILLDDSVNLHQETADRIGTDYDSAKRINFSAVFGIGAPKYSATYGIPIDEAKRDLAKWHSQFPEFRLLLATMEQQAEINGLIRLESGRWRRYNTPSADTHAASSNLVQGTVAEIMRRNQLRIDHHLRKDGVELLLQVHDSVILLLPIDRADELVPKITEWMTHLPFTVPLKSSAKIGTRWGELAKWKGST